MENKLTEKKQVRLERNANIKKSYKNYLSLGYMKVTAIRQTAIDWQVGQATVYLVLKSK